jgi:lipopolysaccharide/colanic/teichoic acid biosynthesis glycosyltransferase
VNLVTLIVDTRPDYLSGAPGSSSLLSMPVGAGTVLGEIVATTSDAGCNAYHILPMFPTSAEYERSILAHAPPGTDVLGEDALDVIASQHESSDILLIFDPRYWPVTGFDLGSALRESQNVRWTVHRVALGSEADSAQEFVRCDDGGKVRRIERYYHQVTWTKIDAVAYSLVPVAAVAGLAFVSLSDLRTRLACRATLSRDVPLEAGTIDLSTEVGLLALNEHKAVVADKIATPAGYVRSDRAKLVGSGCRIHPSSRIVGPVIIQSGSTVEEGATILGPTVLGAGCTVHRGATIVQSVLAAGTGIAESGTVRHSVASGRWSSKRISDVDADQVSSDEGQIARRRMLRVGSDDADSGDADSTKSTYPTIKLFFDVAIAGISLILLSPVMLIAAIAVKIDSVGPVFFGHAREGKGGKVFRCLKFRTMCRDAHQKQRDLYAANTVDGPQFKLHNDPRITRVGAWLRSTNIDELPQLINVFLGQMSLVGPRPSPFRENQICVPWRRARLSVRPGITGLWQICRDQRSEGDFHQWIAYDIMYVRHLSFWLDVKILLATVLTLGGLWNVSHTRLVPEERRRRPRGGNGQRQPPDSSVAA